MNASASSLRVHPGGIDDVRLPTWISIAAPPSAPRSPMRSAHQPPVVTPPRRAKKEEILKPSASKRTQSSLLASSLPTTMITPNVLVELCRKHMWKAVCVRCQSHPEEAVPMPLGPVFTNTGDKSSFPPIKRERKNSDIGLPPSSPIPSTLQSVHRITPLGIACQSDFETCDQMLGVVEKLLAACPEQVQSNESVSGHTPLRDAVRNNSCTPTVLRMLIHADMRIPVNDKAVFRRDRDGLRPVDHLIMGVHAGTPSHSLESLKLLIQLCPEVKTSETNCASSYTSVSPLIRLLSMGTSFGLHMRAGNTGRPSAVHSIDSSRMARVLECTKCLISENMTAVYSRSTKCTPLHVAIRNYGDVLPLIQLLIESDIKREMVQTRNLYGDLPLHVACSVGVPMDVLALLLRETVAAMPRPTDGPHPLVWSVNKSGYTPVDLEWMRHIEGGRGFYEVRSFYPLEASGIRNQCSKQDKFYRGLLQEAVDQVMQTVYTPFNMYESRESQANMVVGALLDRIVLIMQVAHTGALVLPTRQTKCLLHAASALSRVPGPTLPNPLLRLFAWMYPDQCLCLDDEGRMPLHQAVMPPSPTTVLPETTCSNSWMRENTFDRTSWARLLLDRAPRSSCVADNAMRLPLHYALDCHHSDGEKDGEPIDATETSAFKDEWSDCVQHLVSVFPESVDRRDPRTRLYPFMQAATDPEMPTDVVFYLLRRNPALVKNGIAGSYS